MRLQKFVFNATTLIPGIPSAPWTPGTIGVGAGSAEGASGVFVAWETARFGTLEIPLRFEESQWAAVRAFLAWGMGGGTFSFFPDSTLGTSYTCYLVGPKNTDHVVPTTDLNGYMSGRSVTILIRRTDGVPLEPLYF